MLVEIKKSDQESIQNNQLSSYPLLPNQFIIEIPVQKSTDSLYARGLTQVLGYSTRQWTIRAFMSLIHPLDVHDIIDIRKDITKISKKHDFDPYGVVFLFAIRILHAQGHYINLCGQCTINTSSHKGQVSSFLTVFNDVTGFNTQNSGIRKIVGSDRDGHNFSMINHNNKNKILFTARELEILRLMDEGLNSSDIAKKLFISINTVNNHRSNMLHKSQAKNAIQLLAIARNSSFL